MKKYPVLIGALSLLLLALSCNQEDNKPDKPETVKKKEPRKWNEPKDLSYHFEKTTDWLKRLRTSPDSAGKKIIMAVNRADFDNVRQMDSVIVPNDLSGDLETYLPFPLHVKGLNDIDKIIFFSYPTQAFGAYENGELVYAGPTNMGSKNHPTPEGLYFTNWKAEETISTFDDEWVLRWNFNIQNKEGIGWHQYSMPGYPASHSCLRLLESDARTLYEWADQWKLKGSDSIILQGTPVIVFGTYPFGGPKPWLQLVSDPGSLSLKDSDLEALVKPNLDKITAAQEKRNTQPVANK